MADHSASSNEDPFLLEKYRPAYEAAQARERAQAQELAEAQLMAYSQDMGGNKTPSRMKSLIGTSVAAALGKEKAKAVSEEQAGLGDLASSSREPGHRNISGKVVNKIKKIFTNDDSASDGKKSLLMSDELDKFPMPPKSCNMPQQSKKVRALRSSSTRVVRYEDDRYEFPKKDNTTKKGKTESDNWKIISYDSDIEGQSSARAVSNPPKRAFRVRESNMPKYGDSEHKDKRCFSDLEIAHNTPNLMQLRVNQPEEESDYIYDSILYDPLWKKHIRDWLIETTPQDTDWIEYHASRRASRKQKAKARRESKTPEYDVLSSEMSPKRPSTAPSPVSPDLGSQSKKKQAHLSLMGHQEPAVVHPRVDLSKHSGYFEAESRSKEVSRSNFPSWTCESCGFSNYHWRRNCYRCSFPMACAEPRAGTSNEVDYAHGYSAGFSQGYSSGYNNGYKSGYNLGQNQAHSQQTQGPAYSRPERQHNSYNKRKVMTYEELDAIPFLYPELVPKPLSIKRPGPSGSEAVPKATGGDTPAHTSNPAKPIVVCGTTLQKDHRSSTQRKESK